jgi:hypothetical protein
MIAVATAEAVAATIDIECSFTRFPCFFTQLKLDRNAKLWWMLLAILSLSLSFVVLHSFHRVHVERQLYF